MTDPKRADEVVFGRAVRAAVGRWIATRPDPLFFLSEAQEAQPAKDRTAVTAELERFVEADMLDEEAPTPGQRRRYFRRTESPLWQIFVVADRVLLEIEVDHEPHQSGKQREGYTDAGMPTVVAR